MIYTLGYKESYEHFFSRNGYPRKAVGGSVWRTYRQAKRFCSNGYRVYGVIANWGTDTKSSKTGQWHDLIRIAPLVKIRNLRNKK